MGNLYGLPKEARRELNKMYRQGEITKQQFMNLMKNGLFDHKRLALKEKVRKCLEQYDFD